MTIRELLIGLRDYDPDKTIIMLDLYKNFHSIKSIGALMVGDEPAVVYLSQFDPSILGYKKNEEGVYVE